VPPVAGSLSNWRGRHRHHARRVPRASKPGANGSPAFHRSGWRVSPSLPLLLVGAGIGLPSSNRSRYFAAIARHHGLHRWPEDHLQPMHAQRGQRGLATAPYQGTGSSHPHAPRSYCEFSDGLLLPSARRAPNYAASGSASFMRSLSFAFVVPRLPRATILRPSILFRPRMTTPDFGPIPITGRYRRMSSASPVPTKAVWWRRRVPPPGPNEFTVAVIGVAAKG